MGHSAEVRQNLLLLAVANRPRCWQVQGGKYFIPFSTENSNPAPLLTPLEKRGWPFTKLQVSKSYIKDPEGQGLSRGHGHRGWLLPAPTAGIVPPAGHPGQRQRLFGPEVKAGTTLEAQRCPGMEGTSQGGEGPRNV